MNQVEITVKKASEILGLSERQIRYYIKLREIDATKVGREWYVDAASAEAFRQRHHIHSRSIAEATPSFIGEREEVFPQSDVVQEVRGKTNQADVQIRDVFKNAGKDSSNKHLYNLKCYQIARAAFSLPQWKEASVKKKGIIKLKNKVLMSLGAGFYSYDFPMKSRYYNQARAHVGAILALLFSDEKIKKEWAEEIEFLELKLLPALSALIRKIEKRIK